MKTETVIVKLDQGLHARPAGMIAKAAAACKSKITLEKQGKSVDAKRLLSILSLAVKEGEALTITADGEDEEQALETIRNIVETE